LRRKERVDRKSVNHGQRNYSLESKQVENKQQNASRKQHRRSFPGVEFQADTAALYIHKGKQVAFLDIVDISKSSIAVTCASSSKDHHLVLKGFKGLREKYPDGKIILRSDNGGEFIDARVTLFCKDNNIAWIPNNEGQPWEGCYGARSIGTLKMNIYAVCIFLMIVI
jgi:transposase InsO family protein